jgi:hypothetical protein
VDGKVEAAVECDTLPSALLMRCHLELPGASARTAANGRGGVGCRGAALVSVGGGNSARGGAASHSGRVGIGSGGGDDGDE